MAYYKLSLAELEALLITSLDRFERRYAELQRDIFLPENQARVKRLQNAIDGAVKGTSIDEEFSDIRDAFYHDMATFWYLTEDIEACVISAKGKVYYSWIESGEFFNDVDFQYNDYSRETPLENLTMTFTFPEDHRDWEGLSLAQMMASETDLMAYILSAMVSRCPEFRARLFSRRDEN